MTQPRLFARTLPPIAVATLALALSACNARNAPMDNASTPAPTPPIAQTSPGMATDAADALLTTQVKAALLADSTIQSLDVKVDTVKGGVQLSGFVNDQKQIDQAALLARGVSGVTSVDNRLMLKP
jgi:hyperosmotically inducible periplasmic protein